jgi:mono/diheme cytochrome c family protein
MITNKILFSSILFGFSFLTIGLASFSIAVDEKEIIIPQVDQESSAAAFDKMMEVLMHKRCVNCHPSGNTPRQGEDSHLHNFGIVRGEDGHGLKGYTCGTCHQDENNANSGVPGAPEWAVAPAGMVWEGRTRVEIATQMMDPKRNGGRTHSEIEKHLTEHELVLWAWEPGVDAEGIAREKPPVPVDEYKEAVKIWIAGGAKIPTK